MELTDDMRKEMKEEIPCEINRILEKYELPYRMDQVSIMNSSNKISFIGNVRVHDPSKVKPVQTEVESYLKKFGEKVWRYCYQYKKGCSMLRATLYLYQFSYNLCQGLSDL